MRDFARIGRCSLVSARAVGAASSVLIAWVAFASRVTGRSFLSCTSGATAVVSGATHHKIGCGNGFGPAQLPGALEPFPRKDKTRTRKRDVTHTGSGWMPSVIPNAAAKTGLSGPACEESLPPPNARLECEFADGRALCPQCKPDVPRRRPLRPCSGLLTRPKRA